MPARSAQPNAGMQLLVVALLVLPGSLSSELIPITAGSCDGTGPACYIQLGGVHRSDCVDFYKSITLGMINSINALNEGKGFGVRSGAIEDQFFFKLNFTSETYEPGEEHTVGRQKALELFPQLDLVVGMGDKCSGGDPELLMFAEIADSLNKLYFTTRGPSGIMQSEPLKPHFFSTHLNSDEYPATSIQQFALRGLSTVSIIWEDSGNAFFEGVGARAVGLAAERGMTVQVQEQVPFTPDPDMAALNRSVAWSIGNRSEVLILSLRTTSGATPVFQHVLDLVHAARSEHAFKGLWAVNIPWGGNCAGAAEYCAYAVGAAQMSSEETAVYRDELLGLTYPEFTASPHFVPPPEGWSGTPFWDVATITSVLVQAIQKLYRFRPVRYSNFLKEPAEYEALRAYMREGSLIGNTFAGATLFSEHGANAGRSASTMQVAGDGSAKLVFPADIAVAGFAFPAPGSVACGFNFYRNYEAARCPLCAHECVLCHNGSEWIQEEVCGCSEGFWAEEIVVGEGCHDCPQRAVCDGSDRWPYPQEDAWGHPDVPTEFFECKTQRCLGGPGFECRDGFAGIMCEGTEEGWLSLGTGVRIRCPARREHQILVHSGLIMAVLLIFFLLNRVLASRYDSIDLFLDSMQRLAIVSNFWLRWPEQFAPLFTVLEIVLLDADLARPDCVMSWTFSYSFWTQKLLLVVLFLLLCGPVFVSSLRMKMRLRLTWSQVLFEDKYNAAAVNVCVKQCIDTLLMMYPTLAKNTLDTFTCRPLGGHDYLVVDPNFRCWSGNHYVMIVVSALLQPTLVFALPFGSLYLLVRGTRRRTLHEQVNLDRFGVLYNRYEPPYLWWEGWRTLQKLVLVAIQVLLWQYPLLQANMALLLFLLGLGSHYYAQPYASPVLDGMDSASYFVSCLFTMVGISFYAPDFGWGGLYPLTLGGLGLYALMAVLMSYYDVREKVASEAAAGVVKAAAKTHFQQLHDEAEHTSTEECERKRRGTKASLNQLIKEADEGLAELPATLDGPSEEVLVEAAVTTGRADVFKRWTDTEVVTLEAYHSLKTLDEWLGPYVSDQSPTSQFSLRPDAEFFRKINLIFPNFFTWIRRAPPEEMEHLRRIFQSILAFSEEPDEGFQDAIVPGDQSSVLYWLINVANPHKRETLFTMLEMLIQAQPVCRVSSDLESNLFSAQLFSAKLTSLGPSPKHAAPPDALSTASSHPPTAKGNDASETTPLYSNLVSTTPSMGPRCFSGSSGEGVASSEEAAERRPLHSAEEPATVPVSAVPGGGEAWGPDTAAQPNLKRESPRAADADTAGASSTAPTAKTNSNGAGAAGHGAWARRKMEVEDASALSLPGSTDDIAVLDDDTYER